MVRRAISHPSAPSPRSIKIRTRTRARHPFGKKKNFKNRGRACVGEWISDNDDDEDDEQEENEEDSSDDEDVTGIAIKCESPLP